MARMLSPSRLSESDSRPNRELVACDPSGLKTLAVGLKSNQGLLRFGTLVTLDGERALTVGQASGVLALSVDTDRLDDGDVFTIYTGGRFLWKAVTEANPSIVFDDLSVAGIRAKGISFEAVAGGGPTNWISLP